MSTSIVSNPSVSEQVLSILFERILKGEYSPGEQLPSESDIAAEFNVSRASVRTALTKLEASGQISRRHGEGTFVNKRTPNQNVLISLIWEFSNLIKENGKIPRIEVASIETRLASTDEREVLELLDPNEPILEIVRIFYADNEPVIYTKNILPAKLIRTDPDNIDGTKQISQILQEYCGIEIAFIDSNISGSAGNIDIDQLLKVKECSPLLRLEEIFFSCPDEKPILLSDSYLNTMKMRLHRIRPWGWDH